MRRRDWIGGAAVLGLAPRRLRADVPTHLWPGYDFGPGPRVSDRLNQGPFAIEQDDGWFTVAATSASEHAVPNYGLGLVGYAWEESGPSLPARAGRESLAQHVERMASLPFVDVLYIRCDWRDVQKRPGRLDLSPVWGLTLDAARRHKKRVAFRVMISNTVGQPQYLALPDFVQAKVPIVPIGSIPEYGSFKFREPRYDHPEFLKAFRELVELLAAEFDSNPLIEWIDLMQYGFWGESHTGGLPNPFPDYVTAERTMVALTRLQVDAFQHAQLAVNTAPGCAPTAFWSRSRSRSTRSPTVRPGWRRFWKTVNFAATTSTRPAISRSTPPA
jgi:hypothetical protein